MGARYTLLRVLGYGSYSAVCLAVDNETGEKVGCHAAGEGEPVRPRRRGRRPPCSPPPAAQPAPSSPLSTQVALKRVADVLQSPDHCKRVLREIWCAPAAVLLSLLSSTALPPAAARRGGCRCWRQLTRRAALLLPPPPRRSILRRLRHPNIISIRDAFVRPSATGQVSPSCRRLLACWGACLLACLPGAAPRSLFRWPGPARPRSPALCSAA